CVAGAAEATSFSDPEKSVRGFRRSYNSPFLLMAVASRELPPSANDGGRFQLPLRGSAGMGPVQASAPASLFIQWRAPPEPTGTTYRGPPVCQHKMLWNNV